MLDELDGHVGIGRPVHGQFAGDLDHGLAVERHPGRAIGLLQIPTSRQRRAAVEYPDVVEPEEASLESVVAGAVLAVHPPGEVERKLVEGALEPVEVALSALETPQGICEERRP